MKRWTNGLPGATKRLGAMMAQRGLSVSQPRMRADTHDGPEQMLHVRGLIHCCSSHVRRSWSFCLATHGPGHTSWHLSDLPTLLTKVGSKGCVARPAVAAPAAVAPVSGSVVNCKTRG